MSLTLIGELSFFHHDASLLGYAPDERDEPAGDDFDTRCKAKRVGVWIDPNEGVWDGNTPDEDNEENGDSCGVDGEVRDLYARFIAMTSTEQDVLIDDIKVHLCDLIDVHPMDWAPSTEFVLDIIEEETPDAALGAMVLALYFSTHATATFDTEHLHEEVGRFTEYDVVIPDSDILSPRVSTRGPRFESCRDYRRSRGINLPEYNHRSHTRRVTRARSLGKKEARHQERHDRFLEMVANTELEYECDGTAFLSSSEQEDLVVYRELAFDWKTYLEQEAKCHMTHDEFLATSIEWVGGIDQWDFPDSRTLYPDLSSHDCDDDVIDDFDDRQDCNCASDDDYPFLYAADFEDQNGRDDVFEDYSDSSEFFIGHSSCLRFTGRYRPTRRGLASIVAFM
jgi:hypothetical protein